MANKRELKKFIRNTCGALASEIIIARAVFPAISRKEVHNIVAQIAALQCTTVAKVGIVFDKAPGDYESAKEYHKERKQYFATAFKALIDQFDKDVEAIVKRMNAALPEDVRAEIKATVSE